MQTKTCVRCGESLPLDAFGKNSRYSDGRQSYCKPCFAEYMRDRRSPAWRAVRKDRRELEAAGKRRCRKCGEVLAATTEFFYASSGCYGGIQWECKPCCGSRIRSTKLMRLYRMTDAGFASMLAEQGGGCAVDKTHKMRGSNWHIDHDHRTGAVRGILCGNCNKALGYAHDHPATLRALADYLERAPA